METSRDEQKVQQWEEAYNLLAEIEVDINAGAAGLLEERAQQLRLLLDRMEKIA